MRIGLLADIHGDSMLTRLALDAFWRRSVDRVLVLGDLFESGQCMDTLIDLLVEANVEGVYGNHDLGFCHEPEPWLPRRFSPRVLAYMASLRSSYELGPFLFTHGFPFWDPTDPTIYYLGGHPGEPGVVDPCFSEFPHRIMFHGHFHRWSIATPSGPVDWDQTTPFRLAPENRYVVTVHALQYGHCAVFDVEEDVLEPIWLDEV